MHICRTLDYIVDTDLHLYLFVKFDNAKSKGIQIEIELTEPITRLPVGSKEYTAIVDLILDNAFGLIADSGDKKLRFYMLYADRELHLVIEYSSGKESSNKILDTALIKHKKFHLFTTNREGLITQHLVVTP